MTKKGFFFPRAIPLTFCALMVAGCAQNGVFQQIFQQNANGYYNRGLAHWKKGNFDKAIANYNKAIALNPKLTLAYNNRGLAYNDKGDFDKAIADYNKAIALNPKYAIAYNNRGIAYYGKGDFDKAIADYTRAIALNPKLTLAYNSRGVAYSKKGHFDKAIADYNKAIALNPKGAHAYGNRGNAYNNKGDFDKAIADYTKAIELRPGDVYPHIRLYLARTRVGKDGKAELAKFRKTIKDKKWILFVVRMYLGEITPAQCLTAAAHKNPKTDREQKCEAHYYVGRHLLLKGDKPAAIGHFRKCVATGVKHFTEYTAAKAELRRAGGSK